MATIVDSYTQCSLTASIKRELQLQMMKPTDSQVSMVKQQFQFKDVKIDDDDDVICSSGITSGKTVIVKRAILFISQGKIEIVCLRGTTRDCYEALETIVEKLYGIDVDILRNGIQYVGYKTTTKAKFDGPIYGMFSSGIQEKISSWSKMDTQELVNPITDGDWSGGATGLVDIEEEFFDKMYKGVDSAIVIPSAVRFSIWVPTRFSHMTSYVVQIANESVQDFHEDLYYISSEFPYDKHLEIVEYIAHQ